MQLELSTLERLEDVLAIEGVLDEAAAESSLVHEEEPAASGTVRHLLEEVLERPETLVLVARPRGGEPPRGVCVTAPFRDPLTRRSLPVVVALWVAPELRQRGVARALVREAGRLLAARGAGGLAVRAGHNDDALISMGERWGFVRRWEFMVRE